MKNKKSFLLDLGIYKKLAPSDSIIFLLLSALLLIQFFFVLNEVNKIILIETPIHSGKISEGIVGVPVIYNPLYVTTNAEEDVAALTHAGLLQYHNGNLRPQLAEYVRREEDGVYSVKIKKDIFFHDGKKINLQDILHTILMTQEDKENIYYKTWKDVGVEKVSDSQLRFIVPENNVFFPEAFTMPILPYHIWKKISVENRKEYRRSGFRIGAGPYKFEKEEVTLDEKPTKLILNAFTDYVFGEPYIQILEINFFIDSKELLHAYSIGEIDSLHSAAAAEIPALIAQKEYLYGVYSGSTDRVFGLFYNGGDDRILQDPFKRSVLSESIDRESIVRDVFSEFAIPIQSPLTSDTKTEEQKNTIAEIEKSLDDIGWKFDSTSGKRTKDEQIFSISFIYPDIEETQQVASLIERQWLKLGIDVKSRAFSENLFIDIIKEDSFDVALLGYDAKSPEDLVNIWKSGDKKNISTITHFATPKLNSLLSDLESRVGPKRLQKEAKVVNNTKNIDENWKDDKWKDIVYNEIKVEIGKNVPATFLYSPSFLLILPNKIKGVTEKGKDLGRVSKPSDRFSNIHKWYTQKEKIWKFLINKK